MVGPDGVSVSREDLEALCRRHRIRRLSLFGSVLREDFSAASDVDVLVEFETGVRVTFFSLARVEDALSELFGRRADVHVSRSLSPYLRERVLNHVRELYVAA
jgi:predicted nucleotidyltransferase